MDTPDHTHQLHSAAKSNDLEAAELLLRDGVDIYLKDKEGLTPLHILIQKRIEMFDSLYAKEVEEYSSSLIRAKDSKALEEADAKNEVHPEKHLYENRKMDQKRQEEFKKEKEKSLNAIRKSLEANETFIKMLRQKNVECRTEDIKLLKFYSAGMLNNSSVADNFSNKFRNINHSVDESSSWYPGYTALHFASHCNAKTVSVLVKKGANLLMEDAKGTTPLSICSKMFSIKEIQSIINSVPAWQNILFSDGKTTLNEYLSSLGDPYSHKKFLHTMNKNTGVHLSKMSTLWPGYTILHIAVTLLRDPQRDMIADILNYGADVTAQDSIAGSTPIHLAFIQNKLKILDLLLKNHKKVINPSNRDNLSHLHIAAAVNHQTLPKKIAKKEVNLDVVYSGKPLQYVKIGWTPLHTAACTKHAVVARTLLEGGANLLQTDPQGFTPIHLLFGESYTEKLAQIFFASDKLEERVAEGSGLTHLHVAVWKDKPKAIEQLLDLQSNIEATIHQLEEEKLKKFEKCRPIHIAMMGYYLISAYEVLLQRGADIFAKKLDGSSPFSEVLTGKYDSRYLNPIVELIWTSETLQKKIEKDMGMTKLHLACYALDIEKVKEMLTNERVDVNARIRDDSSIWPGFTPLHVSLFANMHSGHSTDMLLKLLLGKGADITIKDAEGNSPVLMALKIRFVTGDGELYVNFLMKRQSNFKLNPTNNMGMSHFHVACYLNEVGIVKQFLKSIPGIDVNQAINHADTSKFAGHTPLLLALCSRAKKRYDAEFQVQTVELLLKHGANVHAVDAFGYTPLHKLVACNSTRSILLPKILTDNTDINKRANDGKTPMEILLSNCASTKEVKYFVERGSQINSYNRVSDVGYMAIALGGKYVMNDTLRLMLDSPDISEVTDSGRNAIHNAVAYSSGSSSAHEYSSIIQELVRLGCDISQQDSQGRTALHLAIKFQNEEAIESLLKCGADVNTVDSHKKSPFSYASEFRKDRRDYISTDSNAPICKILAIHLRKLQLIGLQISNLNAKLLKAASEKIKDIATELKKEKKILNLKLEDAANFKICSRGFSVRQFLYATGPVNLYSSLKKDERKSLDSFFQPNDLQSFRCLEGFLRLQYKNALQRSSLEAPAVQAFWALSGFPLPDLCVEIVLTYLTNFDLKNLMTAADIDDYV